MSRLIDADQIQYTMLYKENWMTGTGVEAQAVWKAEIDKMPTVNAIPLNKKIYKCSHGEFILYDRKWLYEHLRQEFNILASASGMLKRANWINVTNDESVDYEYSCSECGYFMFKDFVDQWKFCPNCGAKMR